MKETSQFQEEVQWLARRLHRQAINRKYCNYFMHRPHCCAITWRPSSSCIRNDTCLCQSAWHQREPRRGLIFMLKVQTRNTQTLWSEAGSRVCCEVEPRGSGRGWEHSISITVISRLRRCARGEATQPLAIQNGFTGWCSCRKLHNFDRQE